jgi:tRNA(Ile2) C34 agmatinyltransferase TiaS
MCPMCDSCSLFIKHRKGLECLLIFLTGKRKYHCKQCGTFFRAIDRRRIPRDPPFGSLVDGLPRRH